MISKCSDILGLKVLKMSLSPFTRRFISMTVYGAVTMLLLYGTASLYWNVKDFTIKGKQ